MNKQERAENRGKWNERASRWKASGFAATKFAAGEDVNADNAGSGHIRLLKKTGVAKNNLLLVEI